MMPAVHEPANRALNQTGQVTQDEPRVLAGEFDLTAEA